MVYDNCKITSCHVFGDSLWKILEDFRPLGLGKMQNTYLQQYRFVWSVELFKSTTYVQPSRLYVPIVYSKM